MRNLRRYQAGLSLVELMVALLIGVILTSGVISVFITSKASYSMNSGLGQVQEEGRFALQTLQPIMVMAGNTGCARVASVTNTVGSGDEVYKMGDAVYGFEYTGTGTGGYFDDTADNGAASNAPTIDNTDTDWTPNLSSSPLTQAALNNFAVQYSDVLMVHEMSGATAPILAASTTSNIVYDTTGYPPSLATGQILMGSVCSPATAEVFQAGNVSAGNIPVASGTLSTHFGNFAGSAFVAPAQTYVFFVGKSPIDGGTSLFQLSLDDTGGFGTPVEIVPGVENMQVLYGVDTTADKVPDEYVTADNVASWADVISVRIALLVHSDPNTVDKAPSATTAVHMLGTGFTDSFSYKPVADRRMRRYFAETFSLRNSLP